ncbi:hypothetical protein F5884DRAFT_729113 [Xylogone sp. PMI_703]|nr:hypothetical protein F5884DRAFT_729113 [Xylogone sp. PMI_703]
MRVPSILFLGALITLVHAASFADLAAQLPACTSCSAKDSLTVARLENLACGVPVQSQQARFRTHAIVACTLAEIAVILRIYSNFKNLGKLRLDDFFIIGAGLATIPYLYLHCTLANLGFGLNIWDVQPFANLYQLLKLFWVDQMMYSVHLYFTKLSILAYIANIFTVPSFRRMVIWFGTFSAVSFVMTEIVTATQCLPASYNWTNWDGEHKGHCNNLNAQTYAMGAINMVCDIIILVMPLPQLYKLQVNGRQKIQLFFMFSLGAVVTTFSVIRLPFLVQLGRTTNPTWEYVEVTIWSIWETELGMICACLPAIRNLLKTVWPNVFRSITSRVRSGKGTQGNTHDQSSSARERSNIDKKNYYELDERSLIGKSGSAQGATPNASVTVIEAA